MKLAKALKTKNLLSGDIARLREVIATQNSGLAKNEALFDVPALEVQLAAKVDELVALKAAIARANGPIYSDIFALAELKGEMAWLKTITVKHGIHLEGGAHGFAEMKEVAYKAQITQPEIERRLQDLTVRAAEIQDRLDAFNHVTDLA